MSQVNSNEKNAMLDIISKINAIEGFDPSVFAVDYSDLTSNETHKRLPVMTQIAWFRMKYPTGKIAVTAVPSGNCFVATAKVYANYKDGENEFLAEATASRAPVPDKPSISVREWAQTAAIGVALRNAGFGLQFTIAGEDFSDVAPDELGEEKPEATTNPISLPAEGQEEKPTTPVMTIPERKLTLEERYQQAINVVCSIKKFAGRTLGDIVKIEPGFVRWVAEKYTGDDSKLKESAQVICEYAKAQAA